MNHCSLILVIKVYSLTKCSLSEVCEVSEVSEVVNQSERVGWEDRVDMEFKGKISVSNITVLYHDSNEWRSDFIVRSHDNCQGRGSISLIPFSVFFKTIQHALNNSPN